MPFKYKFAFLKGFACSSANEMLHHLERLEMFTVDNLSHPVNASFLILFTLLPNDMVFRFWHPQKVYSSIVVTELGMVIFSSAVQSPKAEYPIDITLSGISSCLRLSHHENAEKPIVASPSVSTNDLISLHPAKAKSPKFLIPLPTTSFPIEAQPLKANSPRVVTLFGTTSSFIAEHSANA